MEATGLAALTQLWRIHVEQSAANPPKVGHTIRSRSHIEPEDNCIELRARSEAAALAQLREWRPDLRVVAVERRPTPHTFPLAP